MDRMSRVCFPVTTRDFLQRHLQTGPDARTKGAIGSFVEVKAAGARR
jgi:hypothetical protein